MGLFGKKQPDVDPMVAQRLKEQVDTVRAVMHHYATGTRLTFGAPTRCPNCGDYGFVQSVNKVDNIAHNHCFGCQADWVITLAALRIVEAEPVPRQGQPMSPMPDAPLAVPIPVPVPAPVPAAQPPVAPVAPVPAPVAPVPAPVAPVPAPVAPVPAPVAPVPAAPAVAAASANDAIEIPNGAAAPRAPLPAPAERPMRVIVVEDNPFDLGVLEELADHLDPPSIVLLPVATRVEAEQLAGTTEHDLVLLTLDLPDSSGITTLLEWQHHVGSQAPVIVLSASGDANTMREARLLGAAQFIRKDQLAELADAGATGGQRLEKLLRSTVTRAASAAAARGPRPN